MTRINLIRCDVCGREQHEALGWNDGKPFNWHDLGDGKHACSVECYRKTLPPLDLHEQFLALAKRDTPYC